MSLSRGLNAERGRRRVALIGAIGVVGAMTLSIPAVAGQVGAASSTTSPWMNPHAPVASRVDQLLKAMTLPEKVGQMDQQLVDNVTTDVGKANCGGSGFSMPNTDCLHSSLVDNFTGSLLAGGTDNPPDTTGGGGVGNTGLDWANEYNTIQQYAIQHSRLHIPLLFGVDAVHGFGHPWQAPLFPQSIGM